jgi:hypothetical protein
LLQVVEIVIAMASVDKGALAADPGALQLYPAIPILSSMLDLDLAPAQSIAMNTAVFAALSALGRPRPDSENVGVRFYKIMPH